jgi:hypothetical protein
MPLTLEKMHLKQLVLSAQSTGTSPCHSVGTRPLYGGFVHFTLVERTGSDRMTNRHLCLSQPKIRNGHPAITAALKSTALA